jgi:hypothetical protein
MPPCNSQCVVPSPSPPPPTTPPTAARPLGPCPPRTHLVPLCRGSIALHRWSSDHGGSVWCEDKSGGIVRGWVSVGGQRPRDHPSLYMLSFSLGSSDQASFVMVPTFHRRACPGSCLTSPARCGARASTPPTWATPPCACMRTAPPRRPAASCPTDSSRCSTRLCPPPPIAPPFHAQSSCPHLCLWTRGQLPTRCSPQSYL